jgi:hypothetical protein
VVSVWHISDGTGWMLVVVAGHGGHASPSKECSTKYHSNREVDYLRSPPSVHSMTTLAEPAAGPSSAPISAPSTTIPNSSLEAATFRRLYPRKYLSRFLEEGYRPDGRKVVGWRDAAVNAGELRVKREMLEFSASAASARSFFASEASICLWRAQRALCRWRAQRALLLRERSEQYTLRV